MREIGLSNQDLAEFSANILSQGGVFRLRARGASMQPFVWDGNVLTITPAINSSLKLRDIILYKNVEGSLVAHRIISHPQTGHSALLVRGDSHGGQGVPLAEEQVLGRVIEIQQGTRTISCDSSLYRCAVYLWVKTSPFSSFSFRQIKRMVSKLSSIYVAR